ncbi:MAG: hypothetical protein ACRDXE_10095 [Acidimicrobiales bacterium]
MTDRAPAGAGVEGCVPAARPCRSPGPFPDPTRQAGFAGGADGLIFGLLIFVVGTLLVGNAWAVVDTKLATDAAAREGARTLVEASGPGAAGADARLAAEDALRGYGRHPERAAVTLAGAGFGRCARVVVTVRYPAPLVDLPFVGRMGTGESVTARHSEVVDPFRSGIAGVARCQ